MSITQEQASDALITLIELYGMRSDAPHVDRIRQYIQQSPQAASGQAEPTAAMVPWGMIQNDRHGDLAIYAPTFNCRLAPGSWPDEISRQVVDQPETPEEQQAAFKGWAGPRGIYEPGPK